MVLRIGLQRRSMAFVKVDPVSVGVWSMISVLALSIVGLIAVRTGLVKSFYSSPFVMLAALVSNRVCVRAGLITAALSVAAHDVLFAAPYWAINIPSPEQGLAYLSMFIAAWAVARREVMPPKSQTAAGSGSSAMPFSGRSDTNERSFWVVEPTDDWAQDCHLGEEYARIYIEASRSEAAPPLAWIVRDMIRNGRYTGIECGFMSKVARILRMR